MKDIERQGGIYNQEIMTDVRKAYAQGYEGLPPSDKYQPQYKRGLLDKAYSDGRAFKHQEEITKLKGQIAEKEAQIAELKADTLHKAANKILRGER
jgi:hypothetical protein